MQIFLNFTKVLAINIHSRKLGDYWNGEIIVHKIEISFETKLSFCPSCFASTLDTNVLVSRLIEAEL